MSPALLSCLREGRLAMPRFFATEEEDARAVERKGKEEEKVGASTVTLLRAH